MSKIKGQLAGGRKFNHKDTVWQAVVCEVNGPDMTVLAVGEEATEHEIELWVAETIRLMREADSTEVQAADMHDRAAPRH